MKSFWDRTMKFVRMAFAMLTIHLALGCISYLIALAIEADEETKKKVHDFIWWPFRSVGGFLRLALTLYVISLLSSPIQSAPSNFFNKKLRRYWIYLRKWSLGAIIQSALVASVILGTWMFLASSFPLLRTSLYSIATDVLRMTEAGEPPVAPPADDPQTIRVNRIVGVIVGLFILSMLPVIPVAAYREECWFREGTDTWTVAIWRSCKFGFAHPLFLPILPLAMAVPLALVGLWLTLHYWKGGLERSTLYHALYNFCVIPMIVIALIYLMW